MDAIVAVTAREPGGPAQPRRGSAGKDGASLAVVILVDCSHSMAVPIEKIESAKKATKAAIDALPDGSRFAVVAGRHDAVMVYPQHIPMLESATSANRTAAKGLVDTLEPHGGTAMGQWLRLARTILSRDPSAVRHAILLTDGNNESETVAELERALDLCAGEFVADARGIGDGWVPQQLMRIASRMRGRADGVSAPEDLIADFEAMTRKAAARLLPDLTLRITASAPARLRLLKLVFPLNQDMTEDVHWASEHTCTVSTGSWQAETRHYQVSIDLRGMGRAHPTDGSRVAWIDAVVGEQRVTPRTNVVVAWSEDPIQISKMDPSIAFYKGQTQLAEAIEQGCEAYDSNDLDTAQARFGEAVRLARESGNQEQLDRLKELVHIDDAATGAVRVRTDLQASKVKRIMTGRTVTAMSQIQGVGTAGVPGVPGQEAAG
ncbi:VWA domain-containing protein [Catellatospora sp. TT07R-123]|uniref:VWA domain-containing protein n=1 Tax=Catellatospora sp. TT07R-123 TaxID=2733863 RepID=UPI001BB3BE5C|nr:VWA domain-containing protein [Catellatospora sp. TT07R-123]